MAVKNMDEYMKGKNDLKFRALVCYGLNHHALHQWIKALEPEDALLVKWFEGWSYMRNPQARGMVTEILKPLSSETFELALDFELLCGIYNNNFFLKKNCFYLFYFYLFHVFFGSIVFCLSFDVF